MAKKDEKATQSEAGIKDRKALHERAIRRFKALDDYWSENLKLALEDIKFRAGDEWPDAIKKEREEKQRPCLSFRRGEQYIRQVVNDGRQNRPSVKYRPVDDRGDPKTAEAFQGITRHIFAASGADDAADTALEHAAGSGFGYFRVLTEYENDGSFDQKIVIRRIPNPLSVRLAPHQAADGSDAEDGFVIDEISREAFERAYPNAEKVDWKLDERSYAEGWLSDLNVRVAEYFYKEATASEVYLLADGQTIKAEEYAAMQANGAPDLPSVTRKRTVRDVKVKWCKLSGAEILEEAEFPSSYIPILPVYGTERNVNGKVIYEGLIRVGKGPLQLYNFERTSYAETVALMPKAPYVAAEGQTEGHPEWSTANTENHPVLTYTPQDVNGTPLPPPRREPPATVPTGYAQAIQITSGDIQAAFGMYNASIGAPSNEKSGKAIMARQREGDVSTYHYHDNLNRAYRHLGRILLEMIPRVYDTRRVVRLLGEDGTDKMAIVDPTAQNGTKLNGLEVFNLNAGKFDVETSTGPSYTTKRQESADAMLEAAQANPAFWQTHGDLIVKAQDWPNADEFAKRTKAVMPPPLKAAIEQAEGEGDDGPPPMVRAVMEQAQAEIAKRDQALQQAAEQLKELSEKVEDKDGERAIKEKEVSVKKYEAETARLKEILPALTPEQAAFIVSLTVQQAGTPLDLDLDPAALVASRQMPMGAMSAAGEPFEREPMPPPEMGGQPMPMN